MLFSIIVEKMNSSLTFPQSSIISKHLIQCSQPTGFHVTRGLGKIKLNKL